MTIEELIQANKLVTDLEEYIKAQQTVIDDTLISLEKYQSYLSELIKKYRETINE